MNQHALVRPGAPGILRLRDAAGFACPACGSDQLSVIDSRPKDGSIRRRRKCLACQERFTTFEISMSALLHYESLKQMDQQLQMLSPRDIEVLRTMIASMVKNR